MDFQELRLGLTTMALILLISAGCGAPVVPPTRTPQPTPRIIRHPQPTMSVETDVFAEAGCEPSRLLYGRLPCTGDGPISELGCEGLWTSDLYGGLDPQYPLAFCTGSWWEFDGFKRTHGGDAMQVYRLVIYRDGAFQLVNTEEQLRALVAPITSGDEALSYALLATDYYARYDPPRYWSGFCGASGPEDNLIYVKAIEATHVVEIEDGYEVYLFGSEGFVCGSHPYWAVPVQVRHDGAITEGPRVKLFELYGIECCID